MSEIINGYLSLFYVGDSNFFLDYLIAYSSSLLIVFFVTCIKYALKRIDLAHLILVGTITLSYLSTDYIMTLEYMTKNSEWLEGIMTTYFMFSLFDSLTAGVLLFTIPFLTKKLSTAFYVSIYVLLCNSLLHLILMTDYIFSPKVNKIVHFLYSTTVNVNDFIMLVSFIAPVWLGYLVSFLVGRYRSIVTRLKAMLA